MSLDDLVLLLQRLIDRLVRRLRLGPRPRRDRKRFLIIQIDGLSRAVLEQGLADGRMPFTRSLLHHGHRMAPMSVGLPSSTPAFQMAAMYGVRPDIPGFHYYDKRRRAEVYFPRGGDAALVEATQAAGRPGILLGGSSYGCVFTGGAANSLFSFALIKRPTGAGVLRAVSAFVVLAWVGVKGLVLALTELTRAVLRLLADPVAESARGWKWLAIKIGISVWLRQLFTLAVSRDLYAGVPAIYVNYLDYDVFAHAYGPRHRRALHALRRIDRSIHQLWRVCRRLPEHQYDLYILSDHGQAPCMPYQRLTGGKPVERVLFEDFFDSAAPGVDPGHPRDARERNGVRIVSAGPNAFVYFVDVPDPLPVEEIDRRFSGLVDDVSRSPGIGFVLVRSTAGPVCVWRGARYRLHELQAGPFAGRDDLSIVAEGIRDLMAMESAGDLVLYGLDAPQGNVSFIAEVGAHAGPSPEELHTFLIAPPGVRLPSPITHPIQLYPHFAGYRDAA